jgi:hypothetical protein
MKSEDGEQWDSVAIILVGNPWLVDEIEDYLDAGYYIGAVKIVATGLALRWGFPVS